MKNNNLLNLKILSFLIFLSLILSVLIFYFLSKIENIGADSEISNEILKENSYLFTNNNYYYKSPHNPVAFFEEETDVKYFKSNEIDKIYLTKYSLIQHLDPIIFSNLSEKEKSNLKNYISQLNQKKLIDSLDIFEKILPNYSIILSILYTDSFAKSIVSKAYEQNISSIFYSNFLILRKTYLPLKNEILELLDLYFDLFSDYKSILNRTAPIMKSSDFFIPTLKDLKFNHHNAIDIFFRKISRINKDEIGPKIYSFTSGIVIAAENGWSGSTTFESYKGGGLSPKSGNGVIIYDPYGKRFILYFHLYEAKVKKGQIIKAGHLIGIGGNTGINARKNGHGKHLHLEIYDISKDRFLNCYELKSVLFH